MISNQRSQTFRNRGLNADANPSYLKTQLRQLQFIKSFFCSQTTMLLRLSGCSARTIFFAVKLIQQEQSANIRALPGAKHHGRVACLTGIKLLLGDRLYKIFVWNWLGLGIKGDINPSVASH
jgi:hypothetical protein